MITNYPSIIAIDTGGTFSDVIALDEINGIQVFKLPSTPLHPWKAVMQAIDKLNQSIDEILHGTTVATNAVLERKGATVALVTTKGFADIIEIGRQNRNDIYDMYPSRPQPLVPKSMRFEVLERIGANGEIITKLSDEDLDELMSNILDYNKDQDTIAEKIQSIAISTIFSFLNPTHEQQIKRKLQHIAPTSISSEVYPEYREYERTSTTVMDAYVKPIISDYLSKIHQKLPEDTIFSIMKSDKGLANSNSIINRPVETLFSGLAGGIKAAEFVAELTGKRNLISLDIGGTSTDVASIVDGKCKFKQSQVIDGLPVSTPAVDVVTIGAGGGSLVQSVAGLVKVGPESAGANPGPVAYGKGGITPTITDVDLVFGILPDNLAGGILQLDKNAAINSIKEFANTINMDINQTITGVRKVFHENINAAIRSVSTQRGLDPREFSLLCFGGAGPVHAAELALLMGISEVIIPPYPGIWSAVGLLGGDYIYSHSRGLISSWDALTHDEIISIFDDLEKQVKGYAKMDGIDGDIEIQKICLMRFLGQSFDLSISYSTPDEVAEQFIDQHRKMYGFAAEDEPIEVVACRVNLIIKHPNPVLPKIRQKGIPTKIGTRNIIGIGSVPIYQKTSLSSQFKSTGPMILEQDDTTIFVPPYWDIKLDQYGFVYLSTAKK